MVSRDTAAGYARDRHAGHRARFHALPTLLEGRGPHPGRSLDGALASHLDARMLVAAGGLGLERGAPAGRALGHGLLRGGP